MAPPSLIMLLFLAATLHESSSIYYGNKYWNNYNQRLTRSPYEFGGQSSYDAPIYYLPALSNINIEDNRIEEDNSIITSDILEQVKQIILQEEVRAQKYYSQLEWSNSKAPIVGIVFEAPKRSPRLKEFRWDYK